MQVKCLNKKRNPDGVITSQHHDIHVTSSLSLSDVRVWLRIDCVPADIIKTKVYTVSQKNA